MAYIVFLLATRWGSELGGLNVFNTGLAVGMSQVLPKGSRTVCFVEQLPHPGAPAPGQVDLRTLRPDPPQLADEIAAICAANDLENLQGVLVIGHDVKTGRLAIESTNLLKRRFSKVPVQSAVISHMDYFEYAGMKGVPLSQVSERSRAQQSTVADADHAFAVGPLLRANFASARSTVAIGASTSRGSPVRQLVPGAAEIVPQPFSDRRGLQVFMSGRLNIEDDPIKNGVLAVQALIAAYRRGREAGEVAWDIRGKMFACGVDPAKDAKLIVSLQNDASAGAAFDLEAISFSDQQAEIHRHLADCHVAMMPSWHEGFGLSGWEALCAGVPLVCSRQSGLALLLEELRYQLPDVSFESVEYVNLTGSARAGQPSAQDIKVLEAAISRTVQNLRSRKEAALRLARRLKTEFTWKRCAVELFTATGWILPSSVRWHARQKFARDAASDATQPELSADVLEQILERLNRLDIDQDWSDLCTAFNYLSYVGKRAALGTRHELREQLRSIGLAVAALFGPRAPSPVATRDSGCMDVCWRYMAAASSIARGFREFAQLFPSKMLDRVWEDSFLCRELLFYASRFSTEFSRTASDLVREFFHPLRSALDTDATLGRRLARLASVHAEYGSLFEGLPNSAPYSEEWERCRAVSERSHDVAKLVQDDPALASTALALMALRPEPGRQVADQAVSFFADYQSGRVQVQWRGDKRLFGALMTASISTTTVIEVLRCMAGDEDESIRWAALHLSFSRTLRSRLEAAVAAPDLVLKVPLNEVLGQIVDAAVSFESGHPWLHREFLLHFVREQSVPPSTSLPSRFTVLDFPVSRWLIGPVVGEDAPKLNGSHHPEVRDARVSAQQTVKRVLFLLPPIELDASGRGASRTSTPPLGLGLLATHLASQGHDVQLADLHRFPQLYSQLGQLPDTFDLIGFNTVFTTVKSTVRMLKDIRKRSLRPLLVVGGPVAKLDAWQYFAVHDDEERECWDFAISEQAVGNLSSLVAQLSTSTAWQSTQGLLPNQYSPILSLRDVSPTPAGNAPAPRPDWQDVFLDRRIYRSLKGQYEPARTRAQNTVIHEAHVVMSQGCDWDCVFCTERLTRSGGERRREVDHVLEELKRLAGAHSHLRIQFIDDNLLPQIAKIDAGDMLKRAKALVWTEQLLTGLATISGTSHGSFGWRGIFRLEDFFAYEQQQPVGKFIDRLAASGCRMLAFGIERGNADHRRRLKMGHEIDNTQITDLFGRLRNAGISTKAYFILGGFKEDQASALQTIDFAIQCGVTLAYFAIFKEFDSAARTLSKEQISGDESAKAYLDYGQLAIRWDEAFECAPESTNRLRNDETCMLSGPIQPEEAACYRDLAALGFRFDDLVKYNDFHGSDGPSGALLRKATWESPDEYFRTVEQAYRRFYLRPKFVKDYERLLHQGY